MKLSWTLPSVLIGRTSFVAFYRRSLSGAQSGALVAAVETVLPIALRGLQTTQTLTQAVVDATQPWTRFSPVVYDDTSLTISTEVCGQTIANCRCLP